MSASSDVYQEVTDAIVDRLKEEGMEDVPVIIGGVIPRKDYEALSVLGVAAIFGQEDSLELIVKECRRLAEARRAAE